MRINNLIKLAIGGVLLTLLYIWFGFVQDILSSTVMDRNIKLATGIVLLILIFVWLRYLPNILHDFRRFLGV